MGKDRKHDSNRRERLLGSLGYGQGERAAAGTELSELYEEDVWSMAVSEDASGNYKDDAWYADNNHHASRARRQLANDDRHVGGLSLAFGDGGCRISSTVLHQYRNVDSPAPTLHGRRIHGTGVATSAPVNVPNWSRIRSVELTESLQGPMEPEGGEGEWMPPHEYLAREHGKAVAASVFEGVGRTLKGRDMSRVRDAVWSQTGFFG